MTDSQQAADDALQACDSLSKLLKKKKTKQVWTIDERTTVKATCLTWFNNQRPQIVPVTDQTALQNSDNIYNDLLKASGQAASRAGYLAKLKTLRSELVDIRAKQMLNAPPNAGAQVTTDAAPDFSKLIADATMQAILTRRWTECVACITANAPMAATVMMGGLLEGLLLARVNKETDQKPILGAKAAPKDKKTGKPLQIKEWMLKSFIDVAHELGWISKSAKDVSSVLLPKLHSSSERAFSWGKARKRRCSPAVGSREKHREAGNQILRLGTVGRKKPRIFSCLGFLGFFLTLMLIGCYQIGERELGEHSAKIACDRFCDRPFDSGCFWMLLEPN